MTNPALSLTLEVRSTRDISEDVVEFELVHPDGAPLPEWNPGSHIDVAVGDEGTRQYSLSGTHTDADCWRIAVLLETDGRGGSRRLHELTAGDRITVSGIRNHFPLEESGEYLFIAGGIGITPLVPMIEAADAAGAPWRLVHIGRSTDRLPYGAELAQRFPGRVTLAPVDIAGRTDIPSLIASATAGTTVYCCGPERMMVQAEEAGRASAVDVRVERFVPREQEGAEGGEHAFEVELAQSGQTLTVPADRSILDVVTEAGVPVLSSCTEGTCGSCETEVIDGVVDHRDSILTESERESNTVMFVCCSRARGDRLILSL